MAVSEEKSRVLLGKQFQILTTRSVKKEDLTGTDTLAFKQLVRNGP